MGRVPGLTFTDSLVNGQWYHSGSNRQIAGNYAAGFAATVGTFPAEVANQVQYAGQALSYAVTGEKPSWSDVPFDTESIDERIADWVYPARDRGSMVTTSGRAGGYIALVVAPTPKLKVPAFLNVRNWEWAPLGVSTRNEVVVGGMAGGSRLPFRYVGAKNFVPGEYLPGIGAYKKVGGHHPLSGIAFGYETYDYAMSIGKLQMRSNRWGHPQPLSSFQKQAYQAFGKTGEPLTITRMAQIEIDAMVKAGIPRGYAEEAVSAAIWERFANRQFTPSHIPWVGPNPGVKP